MIEENVPQMDKENGINRLKGHTRGVPGWCSHFKHPAFSFDSDHNLSVVSWTVSWTLSSAPSLLKSLCSSVPLTAQC